MKTLKFILSKGRGEPNNGQFYRFKCQWMRGKSLPDSAVKTVMTRSGMAGDSLDSPPSPLLTSPDMRLKTLAPELKSASEQSEDGFESRRRESLMDDKSGSPVCGICLSEGGKSIIGRIDSCDHYFCFVCIMEWAKVESRCPMCKQRFTSIRRPRKLGVFAGERIVNVPQRDQVYNLSGNATTTRSDPYSEASCMICHSMADESLILLCDLCDSAAHTYCVGMGCTIPEGDWFCHDCAVSRAEHEKADLDVETENGNSPEESADPAPSNPKVSIVDIVKESDSSLLRTLPRSASLVRKYASGNVVADEEARAATMTRRNLANCEENESSARTLRRCCNVHSCIQTLRNNWHSLRNGSLRFSSGSSESSRGSSKRQREGSGSVLLSPNKQPRAENGCVGFSEQDKKDPYDIKKAWKMMEKAKSVQNLRTNGACLIAKVQSGRGSKTDLPFKIMSSNHLCEKQQARSQNLGSCTAKMLPKQNLNHLEIDPSRPQKLEKQKQIVFPRDLAVGIKRELPSSSSESHGYPLKKKVSDRTDYSLAGSSTEYKKSPNKSHMQIGSSPFINTAESTQRDACLPQTKPGLASSSSSKAMLAEAKTEKTSARMLQRKNNDAKTKIQSLVKLNLKLLIKGKQLEANTFKEIARISTHTILAACGLEHSKLRIQPFSSPICNHGHQIQQFHRSAFMPNSCHKCFYAFARDVVQSVVDEKAKPAM